MVSQALAYWTPGPAELLLILFFCMFWLPLIILPIVYVVHSIKTRRRILTEIERLAAEVRSLRQQVEGGNTVGFWIFVEIDLRSTRQNYEDTRDDRYV